MLLQKNSLHCRKIYLINFYDISTALREQIYYKPIYYNCNLFTMDGQYHFSIIGINSCSTRIKLNPNFLRGKVCALQSGPGRQGCGNTMLDLSDLVQFHSGQVENFYLLVLGQVQMYKVNKILINHYELTCCIENIVCPDQLAS